MPRTARQLFFGLLVSLSVLAAVEVGLRTFVEETPDSLTSPLLFQRHETPISSPDAVTGTVLFGGPNIVALEEPAGVRIFFFGGSATEGYHMTPFSSFAGWTQRFLRLLIPDTPVEVINLGAGGEASRQVADLVSATATTQKADLFVVYSGNNEYYELRALKQANPGFDARTELARRRLSGSHLYRHLRKLVRPSEEAMASGSTLKGVDTMDAEIDQDERELGVLLYGEHMLRLAQAAQAGQVPLLLSTVADQQRSFAFHGDPPPLSDGVAAGVNALDEAGRRRDWQAVTAALGAVRPKLKTQADHHAVARLMDRDQRWEEARVHYAEAEYLDPKPRRSSEPMRTLLKSVAGTHDVPVCDVAALLSAQSPGGITGEDVFFDPCHPNPVGHRRIAEILVDCMIQQELLPGLSGKSEAFAKLKASIPLQGEDPFRLDHFTERRAQLQENRAMTDEEITTAIRRFDDGTAQGAALAGHHATLFKLHKGALAWYALAEERGGPNTGIAVSRALTLQRLHDIEGARRALRFAAETDPEDVEVQQLLRALGG
jgi:lysophospholipase L1-like esterase